MNLTKVKLIRAFIDMAHRIGGKVEKEKSPYVNSDGTFVGGFDGCVSHFTNEKGLSDTGARKLCAYIGRQSGKIK